MRTQAGKAAAFRTLPTRAGAAKLLAASGFEALATTGERRRMFS